MWDGVWEPLVASSCLVRHRCHFAGIITVARNDHVCPWLLPGPLQAPWMWSVMIMCTISAPGGSQAARNHSHRSQWWGR